MEFDNILELAIGIPVAVFVSYYVLLGDYWSFKQTVIRGGALGLAVAFGFSLLDQKVIHFGHGAGLFMETIDALPVAILTASFVLAEFLLFQNRRRRRRVLNRASRYVGRS